MNDALRDLARHADTVAPPPLDVAGIIERGETVRRRRRTGGAAVAALSLLATVGVGAALVDRTDSSGPPAQDPTQPVETVDPTPAEPTDRPLVFTDDYRADFSRGPSWPIRTIQYGDRTLRPGLDVLQMDVTDDGLVLLDSEGGVHLADGTSVRRIGSAMQDDGMLYSDWNVVSATAGSLVAWHEAGSGDIVGYDTEKRLEVGRVRVPTCAGAPSYGCRLAGIVDDHVFVNTGIEVLWRVDLSTGQATRSDQATYERELRRYPRAIVAANGDTVDEELLLEPRDGFLQPSRFLRDGPDDKGVFAYGGTDTLGRELALRLPAGYEPGEVYALYMWLDDDRFAAMVGAVRTNSRLGTSLTDEAKYGDILVCDIAEGRCRLAAEGPSDPERYRLVPHVDAPN